MICKYSAYVFLYLLSFCFSWGWGEAGHKIIAEIAERNLTKKAFFKIRRLLPDCSLAEYQHTFNWHFVNLDPGQTYAEVPVNPMGDVVQSIMLQQEILRSKRSLRIEKIRALKFLVHFVGDLHQPLHVGYGNDRGGNDVPVTWFGQDRNLHWVWDGDMVTQSGRDWTEMVKDLSSPPLGQERIQLRSLDILSWLEDARSFLPSIYVIGDAKLGQEYYQAHAPVCHALLRRGGFRLAALLNDIFQ
jgi:hypothetical protein